MKDKWLVTIEIDTYDGDPRSWNWDNLYIGEEDIKIVSSEFQGRVLPIEGEGECDKCANSYELSSRDNRCGDCGNCDTCCTHKGESNE